MPTSPDPTRPRLGALFAAAAALAACGGGGGDPGNPAPPPPPPPPFTLADCEAKVAGVQNTYLNSQRPLRDWTTTQFEGEAVLARREFDAAGRLAQVRYFREDAAARTSTLVARDWYAPNGALERRLRFAGHTVSLALTAGQSQVVNYSWQVVVPAGDPGGSETLTWRYDGIETITLPSGRLQACRTQLAIADAVGRPYADETAYSAPAAGFVKSYYRPLATAATDRGQTYLTELATTSATVGFAAASANSTPTLTACSTLPAGLDLTLTASSATEALSARRVSRAATVQGLLSTGVERRHVTTGALQGTSHFDPAVGFLRQIATEQPDGSGSLRSGRPDLRPTAVGAFVDYLEAITDFPSGQVSLSADRFTHLGHERVTTPAGSFDTCKVRFELGTGVTEVYWLVPGQFFARLETTLPNGTRSVRERIAP